MSDHERPGRLRALRQRLGEAFGWPVPYGILLKACYKELARIEEEFLKAAEDDDSWSAGERELIDREARIIHLCVTLFSIMEYVEAPATDGEGKPEQKDPAE